MEINITNDDLSKLDQHEAVNLVRKLVQADAEESNIPPNIISIPSEINAPDGGIDGKVDGADRDSKQGTIKKGLTCYQIKSGDYRIDKRGIRKLFGDKNNLKPEIENCLKNGTLVIVLTGQDLPIDDEKEKIYKYLGRRPPIEIWSQNILIGYLKRYPKLCLQIFKIRDDSFYYYDDWASQKDMRHEMVPAPKQDDFIAKLRRLLRSETPEHIRVTGKHGIGKTRLVLEALRPEKLSRLCIYVYDPNRFMESEFFKYLAVPGDRVKAILVVDECPDDDMDEIWRRVSKHGNRIKMVTIYDRRSKPRQNMKRLKAPTLDGIQIKQILESYVGPQYKADVWYSECDSSPHAAHIIGENLRSSPGDILRQSETSGWDRYIAYRASTTSIEFERRKKVLLWIGQFRCFGDRESHPSEYKIIEDKIREHTGIEKDVFAETLEELRQMKILRGSDILHVAPKILRVWLWREWHKKYRSSLEPFPLDDMWDRAESDNAYRNLLYWHVDMWQYDETDNPHHAVKEVFMPGGFADRHALLNSYFGADILYKMSKASPEDAVIYLEGYVNALVMDGLRQFRAGRQRAAMILVDAAGRSSLFRRAARVLLLLAGIGCQEADGADNMFVRLFLPAAESVGWTETPLAERVPLLEDALTHEITYCRLVGIKACEAALRTGPFVKYIVDNEAWQRGVIWIPKGRIEYVEYYRSILDMVRTRLKDLNKEEREHLAKVVLSNTQNLLKAPELHDTILTLLREMHDGQHADPEIIIGTISRCMEYGRDKMPEDLQHKLSQLHDEIVGDSYRGHMRRHVAMNVLTDLKIPANIRKETITNLAKRSLNDPQAFNQELVWLVTDEATRGYGFGYALGKMDDGSLFASIRDAQQLHVKSKAAFMGGYLRAVFDKDRCEWERLMHSLAVNPALYGLVPALTSMSGMTDKIAIRILELVESEIDPLTLKEFEFESRVCDVPEAVFQKWLGLLVDGTAEAYKVALNLYYEYYVHGKRHIPYSVNGLLFPRNNSHRIRRSSMEAVSSWLEILDSYVRQGPVTADVVSDVVGMVIVADADSMPDMELMHALAAVAEHHPDKTWEAISALIDPDKNPSVHMRQSVGRAFFIDKTLVEKITLSIIYGWIDKDVERRATIVASLLPHDIKMVAEYAAKYGEAEGVKKALINNLRLESFSGSSLEHCRNKINTVDSLMAAEDRPTAREFLEEYKDILSERCDRA